MKSYPIVVQKYGGSSLSSVEHLQCVAQQVVARSRGGAKMVIVVSAMGKTTNALLAKANDVTNDPSRRELDMLVTAGERISMSLLSMAIQKQGLDAISFTGSQSGIITEDTHQGAKIVEVRPRRILKALANNQVVIVAGYQGVSTRGEVTTLGRGGSDTTAVALTAALAAEVCEIYSDVDGVYSADPNVCSQAQLLPVLDHQTMQNMGILGAKVLNAQAVDFARRGHINIRAAASGDASGKHTLIKPRVHQANGVVAVVGAEQVSHLYGDVQGHAALLNGIDVYGGRLMFSTGGLTQCEVWVHRIEMLLQCERPLIELALQHGWQCRSGGLVSIVGSGLLGSPNIITQCYRVLQVHEITATLAVANDQQVCWGVQECQVKSAVQCLHDRLIGAQMALHRDVFPVDRAHKEGTYDDIRDS